MFWGAEKNPLIETCSFKYPQHINVMHGSRNFRQVRLPKKALTFFLFFLFLSLLYRSQMVNFKKIYHFSRVPEGVQHFPGGVQLFPGVGGSNCLFPIETHITCDFPGGGGVRAPCPPLWIPTCMFWLRNKKTIFWYTLRLAPVLKTIFNQCVLSYTCS